MMSPSRVTAPEPETEGEAKRISRRWPLISGIVAVVLVAALGGIIAFRQANLPLELDTEWMGELVEHRSDFWLAPALVFNNVGGGLFGALILPLLIVAAFCLFRRFQAAIYFAVASIISAGIVQLLKNVFERPRPEDILVTADIGSFPSGHTANAATMAVVFGFIFRRLWVWIVGIGYTVLMLLSRNYLGAHWLSDTVGGLILGAAVAVIVWAPLAHRLYLERRAHPRPVFLRALPTRSR
ncbi:MAG: hypothetical protein JWQ43_2317 [Glaciihabitans sp.]|nr:hypothetical protein [Glaciihabitans sp.]